MTTDIDIAQRATLRRITEMAADKLGIPDEHLEPYGHYKAKISLDYLDSLPANPNGKLILVTAISPTPAGEGKTTTTVGLGDALNRIGKKAMVCLREPSLGPVFGMKGGAAGGGYAQVVPMEDINLHFTGDFSAIALANNLLAAALDNHIHHGNALDIDVRRITWKPVMDMNDRALRDIVNCRPGRPRQRLPAAGRLRHRGGLGGDGHPVPVDLDHRPEGAPGQHRGGLHQGPEAGHRPRPEGARRDGRAAEGRAQAQPGADAENNPAILHGGPFANIAHGCNSVIATQAALKLADYVVTEAGFGADLGAEKFIDIKCRKSGLRPDAVVIVATIRALKYHGGVDVKALNTENLDALEKGVANLERHVRNVREQYGLPCLVSVNNFTFDTPAELKLLQDRMARHEVPVIVARHWAEGGKGAEDVARAVVEIVEKGQPGTSGMRFVYDDSDAADGQGDRHRHQDLRRRRRQRRCQGAHPDQGPAGSRLRPLPGVRGQDAVFVLDRRRRPRGAVGSHAEHPRGAAGGRRRVHRDGLRRRDDHAGAAQGAVRREDRPGRERQGARPVLTGRIDAGQGAAAPWPARTGRPMDISRYRPAFHFSPRRHWINDPNGLVFDQGRFHLYFQHHPHDALWGPMHWGHATSTDLMHWHEEGIALSPDRLGMAFSGCVVIDRDDTSGLGQDGRPPWVALYTQHDAAAAAAGGDRCQHQSLAVSHDDGRHWTPLADNPVLPNPGHRDFRDPKVFWHAPRRRWTMVLAVGDRVEFHSSADLRRWTRDGSFGASGGEDGAVWECPDLFACRVDDGWRWVLVVSIVPGGPAGGSGTRYFVGDFDGRAFVPEHEDLRWVDHGPDHYAGASWHGTPGRVIGIAWMNNWRYARTVPTGEWRGAMSLPRELTLQRAAEGWRLAQWPAAEVMRCWGRLDPDERRWAGGPLDLDAACAASGGRLCIEIDAAALPSFCLEMTNDEGDRLRLGHDASSDTWWIDRRQAGRSDFDPSFAARFEAPRQLPGAPRRMLAFVDACSVELFGDGGLSCLTALVFPHRPYRRARLTTSTSSTSDGPQDARVSVRVVGGAGSVTRGRPRAGPAPVVRPVRCRQTEISPPQPHRALEPRPQPLAPVRRPDDGLDRSPLPPPAPPADPRDAPVHRDGDHRRAAARRRAAPPRLRP